MKASYERRLERFKALGETLEDIHAEYGERSWKQQLEGGNLETDDLDKRCRDIYYDDAVFKEVMDEVDRSHHDGVEDRRWLLWKEAFIGGRMHFSGEIVRLSNELRDMHVNFRVDLEGKKLGSLDIDKRLRLEEDRDRRRELWLRGKSIGAATEEKLVRLMRLLNKEAETYGYGDLVALRLEMNGLEKEFVVREAEKFSKGVLPLARQMVGEMKRVTGVDELMPWDAAYAKQKLLAALNAHFPAEKALPSLRKSIESLGVDFEALPITIDAEERSSKTYGGLCVTVRTPSDVRITAYPLPGYTAYFILYHEFGHALHHSQIDVKDSIFKDSEGPFAETLAEVIAAFIHEPDWWETAMERKRPDGFEELLNLERAQWLVGTRSSLASILFEYDIYARGLEADFEGEFRGKVKEFGLIEIPDWVTERLWAANVMFGSHPVYLQNYFVADMVKLQIVNHLRNVQGRILGEPGTFKFLREEFYADGGRRPWMEKVESATGEAPTSRFLVDEIHALRSLRLP